jgi:hypothetical protein
LRSTNDDKLIERQLTKAPQELGITVLHPIIAAGSCYFFAICATFRVSSIVGRVQADNLLQAYN